MAEILASLLLVYDKILAVCAFKAVILASFDDVYDNTDDENEFNAVNLASVLLVKFRIDAEKLFNAPTPASEPVMSDMSMPFNVNEPVIAALCIIICYLYLI